MSNFPLDFMVRKGQDFLAHECVCVCLALNCRSVFCLEDSRYSIIECFQNFFSSNDCAKYPATGTRFLLFL